MYGMYGMYSVCLPLRSIFGIIGDAWEPGVKLVELILPLRPGRLGSDEGPLGEPGRDSLDGC